MSEPALWRALTRAARAGEACLLRRALAGWLEAAGGGGPLPAPVEGALVEMERLRYGPGPSRPADPARLLWELAVWRRSLRSRRREAPEALPPLNPLPGSRSGIRA